MSARSTGRKPSGATNLNRNVHGLSTSEHMHVHVDPAEDAHIFSARAAQQEHAAIEAAKKLQADAIRPTWELSGLPSERASIISKHPQSLMYSLFSDTSKIQPSWLKLSHSAFEGRKKLLGGGYGRQMLNTSISNDMPEFFPNPERHPAVIELNKQKADQAYADAEELIAKHHEKHVKGKKKDLFGESAYVLPGGMSTLAKKPEHNTRYKTYAYAGRHNQRMTLIEPLITERKREPLVWKEPKPQDLDFTEILNSHHVDAHKGNSRKDSTIASHTSDRSYSKAEPSMTSSMTSGRRNPLAG